MNSSQRARVLKPSKGLAGLFALLMPVVTQGNTVEFQSIGDTYHAENKAAPAHISDDRPAQRRAIDDCRKTPTETRKAFHCRYRERSRFDGRGAIVDLVT